MADSLAITLLRACVARHGGNKQAAAILAALDKRDCPAFGEPVTGAACAAEAAKPMPLSGPAALKRWSICRGCDRNLQDKGNRHEKRS
jgi:hypothetical protein